MKKLIAGNWKMNGSKQFTNELLAGIADGLTQNPAILDACDYLVCPPSLYITNAISAAGSDISVGAQDCSAQEQGAYTGEISAPMIKDCGARYVILGHSERREYHRETSALVSQKAKSANDAELISIICVGETESERDAGQEEDVVGTQLLESLPETANAVNTVIAYEPVWAIGTGKTASSDDVAAMHRFIRKKLKERLADWQNIRILYGGSMKPENAKELLSTPNVDGGLIGGASLKADQFIAIGLAAL